jgi:predicted CXXCH cytochrome family protein
MADADAGDAQAMTAVRDSQFLAAAEPVQPVQRQETAKVRHRSRAQLWIAGAAVAVIAISGIAIAKMASSSSPAKPASAVPVDAPSISMPAFAADAGVPAEKFIGSSACGDCHDDELEHWKKDWHARALAPATDKFVVGNFSNAHFKGSSSEATMTKVGAQRTMRAQGPDGTAQDFPVNWVIGGKRMQDALTVFPDGRWQVLPVYFHVADKAWVDYTEAKQGALTPEHPFWWTNGRRMANHECLDCHTTNVVVAHDDKSGKWTTTATDFTVACESCHGPGSQHADPNGNGKGRIIQPVKAGALGVMACARCHGPRQPLWPLLDADHAFQLGGDYDEAYDPIVVTLPGGGMSSDFFADGKPSTSSFEYQAMLQSACYRKGNANCLTCHTAPHNATRKAELRAEPDALCKSCHKTLAPDHSHHKTATCISCHMPPVLSGVLDHFADHAIDVPAPSTTASHKVPNACGVCHADKKAERLSADIAKWWPGAAKRQARRERLADALDPTTPPNLAALRAVVADADEAPTLRGAAAILLGRKAHASAVADLVPLLASPSVVLRAKGCEGLGDARARTAGDAVARKLGDPSLRVRLACALALEDMRDPRGELALARLANDPSTSHLMLPHLELGRAAMRKRDYATGKRELEQVARLAPYFTDALVELAAANAELGDLAEARRRVTAVLAVEPKQRAALELQRKLQ